MTLTADTRLGPYRIEALAGEGGMGEVYKARDTRLDRTVAIKILPEHVADDPDRRRRFEQEARAVSALNHAHICTLYDIGTTGAADGVAGPGVDYLVMEYVEGQTLADRLAKGPVPLPQALEYATQIADALASAHQAGIVHRDLKPGNIMLTKGGVKLLDFGLAKLKTAPAGAAAASELLTRNPTTTPGSVLGTVQYMAPEQLEGKEVDARADLWALGCVLYEMTTGRQAFEGRSHASLIAAIMEHEPAAMRTVDPMSPPSLEHLVRRCLAKDPDERWQSARDVLHELHWVAEAAPDNGAAAVAAPRHRRERLAWGLLVLALAAAVTALVVLRDEGGTPGPGVVRFAITAPGTETVATDVTAAVISPDGRRLVFTVVDASGVTRLWVRTLDTLAAQPLAGTENAMLPFWSPDSRFVAFFAEGRLKRAAVAGGAPEVICEAPDGRGGSWSKDGIIVFAPLATGSLFQIPADGGEKVEVARPDATRGETALRFPVFLPDGRHFLYASLPRRQGRLLDVYLGDLGSKERTRIMSAGSAPIPGQPGYLLFTRGEQVVAQRFDPSKLRPVGAVVSLGDSPPLSAFDGAPPVSASMNGVLAHVATNPPNTDLVWLDRNGHQSGKIAVPSGTYLGLSLSPDGLWAVATRPSSPTTYDLWLVDLERGLPSRLTFDGHAAAGSGIGRAVVWSPDSTRIAYQYDRSGVYDVYEIPARSGTTQPEPLVRSSALFKNPEAWSKDGKFLVFSQIDGPTGWDLWRLPLAGDRKPVRYLSTPFNESFADISPDGRWLAYGSDETGTPEIYVRSFPDAGERHQVSASGGTGVQWSDNGRELLIWNTGQAVRTVGPILAVDVQTGPTFKAGTPRRLFVPRQDILGLAATSDLQRFLAAVPAEGTPPPSFTVVVNWQALLRR